MKRLWAPWRMEYIDDVESEKSCIFCVDNNISEEDAFKRLILEISGDYLIMMNKFPYNTGHLLVAPRIHTGDFSELTPEILLSLSLAVRYGVEALKKVMSPHGFNVGMNIGREAGAGIADHLHIHIVPRWNGDTNFMPVVGETKVMPQLTKELYPKIKEALKQNKR